MIDGGSRSSRDSKIEKGLSSVRGVRSDQKTFAQRNVLVVGNVTNEPLSCDMEIAKYNAKFDTSE